MGDGRWAMGNRRWIVFRRVGRLVIPDEGPVGAALEVGFVGGGAEVLDVLIDEHDVAVADAIAVVPLHVLEGPGIFEEGIKGIVVDEDDFGRALDLGGAFGVEAGVVIGVATAIV